MNNFHYKQVQPKMIRKKYKERITGKRRASCLLQNLIETVKLASLLSRIFECLYGRRVCQCVINNEGIGNVYLGRPTDLRSRAVWPGQTNTQLARIKVAS